MMGGCSDRVSRLAPLVQDRFATQLEKLAPPQISAKLD